MRKHFMNCVGGCCLWEGSVFCRLHACGDGVFKVCELQREGRWDLWRSGFAGDFFLAVFGTFWVFSSLDLLFVFLFDALPEWEYG